MIIIMRSHFLMHLYFRDFSMSYDTLKLTTEIGRAYIIHIQTLSHIHSTVQAIYIQKL
jgi:hypothetical protein